MSEENCIRKENMDAFIHQMEHLIDEYRNCDLTTADIIGAIELIKFDIMMELIEGAEENKPEDN